MASNFIKYHANCWVHIAHQLSDAAKLEASEQKTRINKAVEDRLKKRVREKGTHRTSSNKRFKNTDATSALQISGQGNPGSKPSISGVHLLVVVWDYYTNKIVPGFDTYVASAIDLSFLPNANMRSGDAARFLAQPESYQTLHSTAGASGAAMDLHNGTTTDEFSRGLAMVLDPMDGVLDWDVPTV